MKVVFAGGGTGGHFYPTIAVAESIRKLARERQLIAPKLYYLASKPFDQEALFENEIAFLAIPAGKMRRYFSLSNFIDPFITVYGCLVALIAMFRIYPDVVFSKGGYASVPVVLAAALLRIPIIIHESDVAPGRANLLAAPFSYRIAVAFDATSNYFKEKDRAKVARTGIPIRAALQQPDATGAAEELRLDPKVPTILVLGGSLGAERINDVIVSSLPELVSFANVIHQTGNAHLKQVETTSKFVLEKSVDAHRYHPYAFLSALSMKRAAGVANLIISRAGMTTVAEIALWTKPSILIPIPETVSHDQRTNAYAYARTGAATVIEEANMTQHVLVSEARRILYDPTVSTTMSERSAAFANSTAGDIVANEILTIGLSHEASSS